VLDQSSKARKQPLLRKAAQKFLLFWDCGVAPAQSQNNKFFFLWRLRVARTAPQPMSQVMKFFCFFLFTKRSASLPFLRS
jgi:hypothetical protein